MQIISTNKKAIFNYKILSIIEAGLKLSGPEVKSVKKGQINLKGSYVNILNGKVAFLVNAHIAPYKPAVIVQQYYNASQNRQLLLHKKQLKYLFGKSKEAGIAIIPLKVYLKNRLIKLEIGICRGKKKYDKRETIKKRDFKKRKRQLTTF